MCRLNNMLLNDQCIEEEFRQEVKTILKQMKTQLFKLWSAAREILRVKYIAIQANLKK